MQDKDADRLRERVSLWARSRSFCWWCMSSALTGSSKEECPDPQQHLGEQGELPLPPLSDRMSCSARCAIPADSMASAARARVSSSTWKESSPMRREAHLEAVKRASMLYLAACSRQRFATRAILRCDRAVLPRRIVPATGRISPKSARRSDDFPAPFGRG